MTRSNRSKADGKAAPAMLGWSRDEKERFTLVFSGLKAAAKRSDAPAGLAEFTAIATAMDNLAKTAGSDAWKTMSAAERAMLAENVFAGIREDNYKTSFLNPDVSAKEYGNAYAQVISILGTELLQTLPYLMRGIRKPFLYACELIAEVFGHIEKDGVDRGIKQSLYYYVHDYFREYAELRVYEKYSPEGVAYVENVIRRAAEDEGAMYEYGLPVSEDALAIHRFLAKLPQAQIDEMAKTFVNGFCDSFETMRIDRTKKNSVSLDTFFGFERVTAKAMDIFREEGLEPRCYLQNALMVNRCSFQANGMAGNSINRQYGYDHRNDDLTVLQRPLLEECKTAMKEALEPYRSELAGYAGPAVQEIFGTPDIAFVNKRAVPVAKGRSGAFVRELQGRVVSLVREYIDPTQRTFTIIAYPVPAIGDRFEDVFRETIRCNTLSNAEYKKIHQKIIDVLDRGAYVTVKGCGANETDMKVMLHTLSDPATQTNFENCGADVNIPVGEVFTSPVLKGTEGTLHVTNVCIDGTSYKNLRLTFSDGMIKTYSCENFATEAENKTFLDETIMNNHETLPIGEFAIGTNTVAYAMGIRYDVQEKLPILIAEKTGPHFAVGDTCYSHSEDHAVYNPDGKEIIARENEVSALRATDETKAYMNCHTDITIPFDELGSISVHDAKGKVIADIIRNGRFVIPGTEELNKPLEELAAGK